MTVQDRINKRVAQIEKLKTSNEKKIELNKKIDAKIEALNKKVAAGKTSKEAAEVKIAEMEDIRSTREWDIKWNKKQIKSLESEIEALQPELKAKQDKEAEIERMMEVFGVFAEDLEKTWNTWDLDMKAKIGPIFKEEYKKWQNLESDLDKMRDDQGVDAVKAYKRENGIGWDYYARRNQMEGRVEGRTCVGWKTLYESTEEQIRKANHKHVRDLIYDLIKRVEKITGEITDFTGLHVGNKSLEGFIVGKQGKAEIWSILAGGYNIQRLHVRVLVKER